MTVGLEQGRSVMAKEPTPKTREEYLIDFEKKLITAFDNAHKSLDTYLAFAFGVSFLLLVVVFSDTVDFSFPPIKTTLPKNELAIYLSVVGLANAAIVASTLYQIYTLYGRFVVNSGRLAQSNSDSVPIELRDVRMLATGIGGFIVRCLLLVIALHRGMHLIPEAWRFLMETGNLVSAVSRKRKGRHIGQTRVYLVGGYVMVIVLVCGVALYLLIAIPLSIPLWVPVLVLFQVMPTDASIWRTASIVLIVGYAVVGLASIISTAALGGAAWRDFLRPGDFRGDPAVLKPDLLHSADAITSPSEDEATGNPGTAPS
jgi:hypothetical protein